MLNYQLPLPYSATQHIIDGSKLTRFLECPRSFFYEYLLGWRSETPNNHLVFGQAFHDALEHILLNGLTLTVADEAYEKFLETYRKTFSPAQDELFAPKTPERARRALQLYVGRWTQDPNEFEVLHTEIAGRISVDDERHLYFRMDSIIKYLNDETIGSLEHKTGSQLSTNWREQWDMCMQAGIYTHVLKSNYENVHGVTFNGIFFKKVKDPSKQFDFARIPVCRTNNQMLTWWQNTLYWLDRLEDEYKLLERSTDSQEVLTAFPLNVTACSKYFGCRFREFCNSWTNPLQRCAQPPLGFVAEFWDPSEREAKLTLEA